MNYELINKLRTGIFPNDKNRVWTMCQVVLQLASKVVDEAERLNLTDEQFYLSWEDALNILSVKDHSVNERQNKEFENCIKEFKNGLK